MKCIKMGSVGHDSQVDMPLLTGGIFSLLRVMRVRLSNKADWQACSE